MRFVKSRRALSSLVTSAILLTSTVLMGTGVVGWSNSNLSSYQTSISNTYSSNVNKLNEDAVVENVWFGTSPTKYLNVTITNTGTIGMQVANIKLTSAGISTDFPISNVGITPKNQFTKEIYYNWSSATPVDITVTTLRGTTFTSQVLPQ